jgi:hypothetical protein
MISWPFLAKAAKFSPDFPHKSRTSPKVVTCWRRLSPSLKNSLLAIVADATGVPELGLSQGRVGNQVTTDDDAINIHEF